MNERLYTVVDNYDDEDYEEVTVVDGFSGETITVDYVLRTKNPHPEEWEAFCLARYGEVKPFFLPATGRIYRSRSSAVERADLINYWGGKAIVLECTPRWETMAAAKKRRATARQAERVAAARKKLDAELAKLEEVSS